jgi:hypothetical protein
MNFFPFPPVEQFPFVMRPLEVARQAFARLIGASSET